MSSDQKNLSSKTLEDGTKETPCPNLNCSNFVRIIPKQTQPSDLPPWCGGKVKMCLVCKQAGFRAYNGTGDGLMIISHSNSDLCHEYYPIYPSQELGPDDIF